jgi:tRNA(Ile)-lysidine synthase
MCASAASIDAAALFAPLASEGSLLLAVSGGPDSVALMLLAAQWSLRTKRDIATATIDHGLRPESHNEALLVGQWARAQGFSHHLLTWRGVKPSTRIQERARKARYQLLAQCAHDVGATAIVTAHHADDQAETILFRLTRGSGVAGLAGMAAVSSLDDLRLRRPLLSMRKQQLEAVCVKAGHDFLRDPSNENPDFARTRLRLLKSSLAQQGLDCAALLRLGARAAQAEEALAWSAARILASSPHARGDNDNVSRFDALMLQTLPKELLQRVVATQIARFGARQPPRLERLESAAQRLAEALAAQSSLRLTLGGALITLDKAELTIEREPPRRALSRSGGG